MPFRKSFASLREMKLPLRLLSTPRRRASFGLRCFASLAAPSYGRTALYRRICGKLCDTTNFRSSFPNLRTSFLTPRSYILACLSCHPLPTTCRTFTSSALRLKYRADGEHFRDTPPASPSPNEDAESDTTKASSQKSSEDAANAKQSRAENAESFSEESQDSSNNTKEESNSRSDKEGNRKKEPPPPPPHGDKTPWQVFKETLSQEFQASKEWNESTKALASSAHQFTENESVKRARAAYTAASGAATSTTSSALRGTGKVLGQGAAWTWDTPVVKGVRSGVRATGRGIEKVTRPVRETNVYKTTVGGVKEVIDDGSSSRYGGWIEKEERRKQRERELNDATASGRAGKGGDKVEEDPKSVSTYSVYLYAFAC